jgi:hypothetical protein
MFEVIKMWPNELYQPYARVAGTAAVIISMFLLGIIAFSSSNLALGARLGRLGLGAHVAWIAVFLYFYCTGMGPLAIRFAWRSGEMEGVNNDPLLLAVPLVALVLLYSAIPIFVSRSSTRLSGRARRTLARTLRVLSASCIAAFLGFVLLASHQEWEVSELMGLIALISLGGAFVAAETGAAMGDRFSRNMLLAEAAAIWLLRVVRI